MNRSSEPKNAKPLGNQKEQYDSTSQDYQPESGSVDRKERMNIRQSSPENPRVENKPEVNQEEA